MRLSTIGAEEFNGRVRDGNGFRLLARTTRSAKDGKCKLAFSVHPFGSPSFETHRSAAALLRTRFPEWALEMRTIKIDRAIRTGKLNALLRLHTRPINVVVYDGS